eukprot:6457734-Amphidinium_carterae.1
MSGTITGLHVLHTGLTGVDGWVEVLRGEDHGDCSGLKVRKREIATQENECGKPCDGPLTETVPLETPRLVCGVTCLTEERACPNVHSVLEGVRRRVRKRRVPFVVGSTRRPSTLTRATRHASRQNSCA